MSNAFSMIILFDVKCFIDEQLRATMSKATP